MICNTVNGNKHIYTPLICILLYIYYCCLSEKAFLFLLLQKTFTQLISALTVSKSYIFSLYNKTRSLLKCFPLPPVSITVLQPCESSEKLLSGVSKRMQPPHRTVDSKLDPMTFHGSQHKKCTCFVLSESTCYFFETSGQTGSEAP